MSAEVRQTRSSRRRPGTGDEPTGTGRAEASGGAGGPPLGPSGAWGWLFLTSNNPGLRGPAARGPRPRCVALGGTAPAWDLVSPPLTMALRGVALWLLGCGRQRAAQPLSRGPKRDGRGARRGGGGPRLSAAAEPDSLRRRSPASGVTRSRFGLRVPDARPPEPRVLVCLARRGGTRRAGARRPRTIGRV